MARGAAGGPGAAPEAAAAGAPPAGAPVETVELLPGGPVVARLAAPPSKSVTNRALACAALAAGGSRLGGALGGDDAEAMAAALGELGAPVAKDAAAWTVHGSGGRPRSPGRPLDARLSGTTMRFLAAVATLTPSGASVGGRAPLLRRPVGPLVTALRALGAEVTDRGGFPPVTASGGGLDGGEARVDASASSQFASAVLLVAPYARRAVRLHADGLGAAAYVELTAAVMRDFGAAVDRDGPATWLVEPGRPYRAADLEVEYDASAAAHLFAVAAATGGAVTVTNARQGTLQPDAGLPGVLAAMGATVAREGPALTVSGPQELRPVDVDLAAMPDQVTTVAALAALARGASRLRGVAVARGHETDRLAALATELGKLGVTVQELPDGLVVHGAGPDRLRPARLATHGDHRMAMALAAVAARVPGLLLEDPGCVAKTYPGFWQDLDAAGLRRRPGRVQ